MLLSYLNHYGTNCVLSCQVIWDSFATHMDCGPPGSSVHGIFQARTLQWVAISSTRVQHCSGLPFLPSGFFLTQGSNPRFLCLFYWQIRSLTQLCLTLGDPMNHSTPGLPVHHQLPEFTQTHVHRVGDALQPSHPLSSPSPPAPNPSQHQSLFQ